MYVVINNLEIWEGVTMNLLKQTWCKWLAIGSLYIGGWVVALPAFTAEDQPRWGYGGVGNPTQWGKLTSDFSQCELGRDQSPINVNKAVTGRSVNIQFNYQSSPLAVVNNGHTVQVNYQPGSTINIEGKVYELLQFHFHTPSEHTIDGKAAAMEVHLVHRNAIGQLAVIGILMNPGAAHPTIEAIWRQIPTQKGEKTSAQTINAVDLLPQQASFFSYTGSLTTPPCSEGVKWHLMVQPIELSAAQIAAFESLYPVNARPIQPHNGRLIQRHGS